MSIAVDEPYKENTARPSYRLSLIPIAGTLLLIGICLALNHRFFHDDTYITLRYARHLLAGYGPVWNMQGPRVEGFTSPLHLLLVSGLGAVGFALPVAARVVNMASHAVLVVFLFFYLKRRTGQAGAELGAMLVAASWIFLIWDLGGLDAVLYAMLGTVGVLTGTRAFEAEELNKARCLIAGCLMLAFATLARPEGFLLLVGLCLLTLIFRWAPLGERIRTFWTAVGVSALVLAPVSIFRWFYFHALVPNTMYAKIGGIDSVLLIQAGFHYLFWFLIGPPALGTFAVLLGIRAFVRGELTQRDAAIWILIGLSALFAVVSGGDHMRGNRFCLLMYALMATVLVLHLSSSGLLVAPRLRLSEVAVFFFLLALQVVNIAVNPITTDPAAAKGRIIGEYIDRHWAPESVVALNTAGSTPYYADRIQYIDMLGLNDAEIAHRRNIPTTGPWTQMVGHLKGDGASVLRRRPDYIILGTAEGTTTEHPGDAVYFIGDYEIGRSPRFQSEYELCAVPMRSGFKFTYYQRRDAGHPCPAS